VEYEYWKEERDRDGQVAFERVNNQTFDDSVLPIMDLAQLIEGEHALIDDLLLIKPTPGHTPGSISLCLSTNSQQALFTGDIFHHPIQVYQPEWNSDFCAQPEQARTTRRETLEYCAEEGALMMPAHFGPSHAGRVTCPGGSFSFDFVPPS
jgi:glyoxylase-like metal-dependent hydrolase (beta-lactamase superfamily II)